MRLKKAGYFKLLFVTYTPTSVFPLATGSRSEVTVSFPETTSNTAVFSQSLCTCPSKGLCTALLGESGLAVYFQFLSNASRPTGWRLRPRAAPQSDTDTCIKDLVTFSVWRIRGHSWRQIAKIWPITIIWLLWNSIHFPNIKNKDMTRHVCG